MSCITNSWILIQKADIRPGILNIPTANVSYILLNKILVMQDD